MAPKLRNAFRKAVTTVAVTVLVSTAAPRDADVARDTRVATAAPRSTPAVTASPDRVSEARRSISEREYEATDAGEGLQAPNRAHGLRTYFDARGARVVDREGEGIELARLRTVAVGRGEPRRVADGETVADGARVEVRRAGFVEWYENSERGLEQGWTLSERPDGDGSLAIDVDFGKASARVEGDRATVVSANGRQLEYGGLAASDATGSPLAVRMESTSAGSVRIVVDDRTATYPVTVDPVLTQPAFSTLMGDQAGAQLGFSVAAAGDVNGDGYDDVIVGAPFYDAGQTDEGAAFVFRGGPNGIASAGAGAASARLESNQANAQLGVSVAGAGDVNHDGYDDVIVGAYLYDSGQTDEGAAYVFLGGPSGVANGNPSTAATNLQSNQAGAAFGFAVAGAGDVNGDGFDDVVVGASGYDAGQTDEGAAFVFLGSPSGVPSGDPSTAATTVQSNQIGADLGYSAAGAGDVNHDGFDDVVVGVVFYDSGETDEGAAFVFLGSPSGVASGSPASANAFLQANQTTSRFGVAVAGAGDTNGDGFDDVIVGARFYDAGETDEGAAFVFRGGPAGVANGSPSTASATLQSNLIGGYFGASVASVGDVNGDGYDDVVVGATGYDAGQTDEGAAFVFFGGASGVLSANPSTLATTNLQSDQAGAFLGSSAAGAGDVNGDGFDDLVVGASGYDSGQTDEGAAFVYLGGRDGLNGFPSSSAAIESNQADANLGAAVASAGDVNDDGYDDVIVGAPAFDSGESNEGAAFVFLGGPAGVASGNVSNANGVLQSNLTNANFGRSVAGAGDTNGDGYDDVIVGAPGYGSDQEEGAAFVFLGGPSGIGNGSPSTAASVLQSEQSASAFGYSVAGAGDVNNDGYDDVVVGAEFYTSGQTKEGAAFVFHGGPSGIGNGSPSSAAATLQSDQENAVLGSSVAGAGDTNGDGYDDVIVGAPDYDSGQNNEGAAFVFLGGPAGVGNGSALSADAVLQSDDVDSGFGVVASAGDVNGDGYGDVIVGALSYDATPAQGQGGAFVFLGGPSGVGNGSPANADTILLGDEPSGRFGLFVAGVGDVNGDGFDDVAVSKKNGFTNVVTLVFLGGFGGVASVSPHGAAATVGKFSSSFTSPVAGAGDTNGDGYDDVIVGFPGYSNGQSSEGGAFVYFLQRPPAGVAGADTVGIYVGSSGAWFLRNANAPGGADTVFTYGPAGGGLVPLRGDWDGDGDDTPGLYVPATGVFFLRNTNAPGGADVAFQFGAGGGGFVPMVGDWNGDGTDTVGLFAPSTSTFFLRNENAPGGADLAFSFGAPGSGWTPIAGDWDGDGTDTVGLFAPSSSFFFLRNANAPGGADVTFGFGPAGAGWKPVTGDYDGNGTDTVGLYSASNGFFFLRNANAPGAADLVFGYGPSNVTPLVGDWDGN